MHCADYSEQWCPQYRCKGVRHLQNFTGKLSIVYEVHTEATFNPSSFLLVGVVNLGGQLQNLHGGIFHPYLKFLIIWIIIISKTHET